MYSRTHQNWESARQRCRECPRMRTFSLASLRLGFFQPFWVGQAKCGRFGLSSHQAPFQIMATIFSQKILTAQITLDPVFHKHFKPIFRANYDQFSYISVTASRKENLKRKKGTHTRTHTRSILIHVRVAWVFSVGTVIQSPQSAELEPSGLFT